ncbi:MAG: mannonate dehydratase [Gammaproteobacteria bacterium]|nr:mannonate dehydratase [Gammaproteobacteria bacterium]
MQQTWRWFGPNDPVSLTNIVQAGATGIVTSLHHVPTGDAWLLREIEQRKQEIEAHGLQWSVVESIPLHNDLKTRSGNYTELLENYKTSVRNVGAAGIKVVCYNFMPVVDWTRTNLDYELPNASRALRFEMSDFAAYDVYVLQRSGAEQDYTPEVLARAKQRLDAMTTQQREQLEKNIIAGLPGGEGSYDRDSIRAAIAQFIALGTQGMRDNLFAFLHEIIPVAEEAGVRMCIHPDDPPFSLFGLPRVVSTAEDARQLLDAAPSMHNGITLCAGSFGARADNDLIAMVREFGPRIHFVHLRNIRREDDGSFFESEHLDGDNDMVGLIAALLDEEDNRRAQGRLDLIPMRPDHGHTMADEIGQAGLNPGYSFGGRMKGLAELRGVMHALEHLRRAPTTD